MYNKDLKDLNDKFEKDIEEIIRQLSHIKDILLICVCVIIVYLAFRSLF